MKTPFNKPYLTGKETDYIKEVVDSGKIFGDGLFTKKCHQFFEEKYGFKKCLLTTYCTDVLEMTFILLDIQPGDEVITPSFTFVSSVNAFVLRGAKIVFADSEDASPNIDTQQIESLITSRIKAIVVDHYAGIACDMDTLMTLANKPGISIVEDAAQAINSFYKGKPFESIRHLSTFSFHETKNIISGERGMLVINDHQFIQRAEIIREKGTNRPAFFRGEIDKYGWGDVGSAFLYAQLENLEDIQTRRKEVWQMHYNELYPLQELGHIQLPYIPSFATNNAHMFYLVCDNIQEGTELISFLKTEGYHAVFHYLSLHKSPYYFDKHDSRNLPNCDKFADCLLRLPFFMN